MVRIKCTMPLLDLPLPADGSRQGLTATQSGRMPQATRSPLQSGKVSESGRSGGAVRSQPGTPKATPRTTPRSSPRASPQASPSQTVRAVKSAQPSSGQVTPSASPSGGSTPRATSEAKSGLLRGTVSARTTRTARSSPCASPSGGSTPRTIRTAPSFGTPQSRPDNVELLWGSGGDAATEGSRTPHSSRRVRRTPSATSLTSSVRSDSKTVGRANSLASRKRPPTIPEGLVTLRDVCNGEAQRLTSEFPDWEVFFTSLTSLMRDEVMSHLKSCGKCRAVSSFSRCNSRFQVQPFSESSLATVCQSCLQTLNASLVSELQKQKDTLLTDIAEALGMPLRDLLGFEGVTLQRQDARLTSLPIIASECQRILSQAHLRESTQHIWIEPLGPQLGRQPDPRPVSSATFSPMSETN